MTMNIQYIPMFVRMIYAVETLLNLSDQELVCLYKECLVMVLFVNDINSAINCYLRLGYLYSDHLFQYRDAKESFERGLNLIAGPNDAQSWAMKKQIGDVYLCLGKCCHSMEDYNEAILYYTESLRIFEAIGDCKTLEALVNDQLGDVFQDQDNYVSAFKYFEKSLEIYKILKDRNGEKILCLKLGHLHQHLGNAKEALTFANTSLDIAKETDDLISQARCYGLLGRCYQTLKQRLKAKNYYAKQLKTACVTCDKIEQKRAYNDFGIYYYSIQDFDLALHYFTNYIRIVRELGEKKELVAGYCNLGNLYSSFRKFDKAIGYYNKAMSIYQESNVTSPHREATLNTSLGICYLNLYFMCVRKGAAHLILSYEQNVKQDLARIIYLSMDSFKKAIEGWEGLFDQLQEKMHLQVAFFDQVVSAYRALIEVLLQAGDTQQALLYSERARARVLVNLLTTKYGMTITTTKSLQSYGELETVWSDGRFCILCYRLCGKHEHVDFVWRLSNEEQSENLHQECTMSPLSCCRQSKIIKLEWTENSISELLADVYGCLKIQVDLKCENRAVEAAVSPVSSSTSTTLTRGHDGNTNAKSHNTHRAKELLKMLFTLLVPAVPSIQQEELVIVPEGSLNTVPFPALIDPNTGKYLYETKRIRLVPSITILKRLQESPADYHSKTGALIIGNPDIGQVMFRGKVKKIHPLKFAEEEAIMIAGKFDKDPLTGAQASKDKVLDKLKEDVAVIHIATHGCAETGEILLAPPPTSREGGRIPEEEDYLLTMKEVQEVGVRAQLVVLSCCQSGRGDIRAEGVVGLARAFLAAGARSVVASLWPINDEATLSFMFSFYEYLKKGKSASTSMQYAMNELRESQAHPKYWASFFLMGDDVTISQWH